MEYENKHGASGTAKAGLTLGIIGSALGLLNNGNLGGVLGGGCNNDHYVNRYEAEQSAKLAEAESKIRLLEGNTYTDSKIADVYERLNIKISGIESQLCQQNVVNAQVTANLACLQNTVATLSGLTKTVIPITSVCPEPMPQYNSWTAPTAGA
jgi:hypothetical protein